jgi:integrase
MSRTRNQAKQVVIDGRIVEGVYRDPKRGFYIFDENRQGSDKRRSFGVGPGALERAIAAKIGKTMHLVPSLSMSDARRELEGYSTTKVDDVVVRRWQGADIDEQSEILRSVGIGSDVIAANPSAFLKNRGMKIDPSLTIIQQGDELAAVLQIPERWNELKRIASVNSDNPNGKRLTLDEVSDAYQNWYTNKNCDELSCLSSADAHNEQAKLENAEIRKRIAEKQTAGELVSTHTKSLRLRTMRTWVDFAPRKVKNRVKEHQKYWGEFAAWTIAKYGTLTVDQLAGDVFLGYQDHVSNLAKSHKPKLMNPDVWKNHRYNEVIATLRRAKKRHPDAAWAKGLFGIDGNLRILEKTTPGVTDKIILAPKEFKLLLDHADPQWKAILYLSMNASLSNTDIVDICWEHCENGVMRFPRSKNKNPRLTPLHPLTVDALTTWKGLTKSQRPNIFVNRFGETWEPKKIGTNGFDKLKAKVEQATGVKIAGSLKSIRKSAATCVQEALQDARITQTLQGHETQGALKFYLALPPSYMQKAVDAIAARYF